MLEENLVFEVICAILNTVLLGEGAGIFFATYRKAREPLSRLLTLVFCCFCGSSIFYFFRFFIQFDPWYYRAEVSLRFAAFTTFVYLFERQVKQRRFPMLTVLCFACIAAILILPYDLAYASSFTIYIAALAVFWFFLRVFLETEGKIQRNIGRALTGGFVLGLGIGVSADLVVSMTGRYMVTIGLILELCGIIIVGISFYSIRTTDEFRWPAELQSIFIIFNSLCVFPVRNSRGGYLKHGDFLSYFIREREDAQAVWNYH